MQILMIEPFYGGSHRSFADGLVSHSRHRIDLVTLPARFWKWRMRGAALYLAPRLPDLGSYDAMMVTSLLSLSDLSMLLGRRRPPTVAYFHENQMTYPTGPDGIPDAHFGITDMTTALAADRVLFNSNFHRAAFLDALPLFIKKMPEYYPKWIIEAIASKSGVCYPGCDLSPIVDDSIRLAEPPTVVWNHRWEHDKDPETFFRVMGKLRDAGLAFRLAILGQSYSRRPKVFDEAAMAFPDQLIQFGHATERSDYEDWLRRSTVVVSTANQENFGIAVVEAMGAGCFPLLPDRLSYPELIPDSHHSRCLYRDEADLEQRLAAILKDPTAIDGPRLAIANAVQRFSWQQSIAGFDAVMDEVVSE